MGSTRFPGKPLARISGRSMLSRVIENSVSAFGKANTMVATCDDVISSEAELLGVRAIMTAATHERATDRTAEAVRVLEGEGEQISTVIMLQGDEPLIPPRALKSLGDRLASDPKVEIVNLGGPIRSVRELKDPNCIKVVTRLDGRALFFSRANFGYDSPDAITNISKQVCAIGFQRSALAEFASLQEGQLEKEESIDMLRWLENGREIYMEHILTHTQPVDVPADIGEVEKLLQIAKQDQTGNVS